MARIAVEQQLSFARGMNDTATPTEYRPDECQLVHNGRISFDGQTVRRRGGSVKTHSTALNSAGLCYGAIEYHTAAGVQQLVVFVDDKAYTSTDEGVTWTEQATGLTTGYWSLVIMRQGSANVLCAANGGTNSYQWNGTTWATISNIPNDVKYLAVFNNRLWAAGHAGITVVASKVGDLEVYATPDGLSVQAQTHDGDTEMTGLYQLGTVLLAFKEESCGYIEGFGFNTLEVEAGARGISRSVGCVAYRSIAAVGNQGVMWLSKRGLEYYELGGVITLVSRPIQNFIDGLSWASIDSQPGIPSAIWWPQRHEYWCAMPVASSRNDNVVVYRPPHIDQPPALTIHRHVATDDDTLYVDSNGYLEISSTSDRDQGDLMSGYLVLTASGGQFMKVSAAGYLEFASADHDHATLFIADLPTADISTTPMSGGYDGFVRQLEAGNTDNATLGNDDGSAVTLKLVTRPFIYGDPFMRKRGRQGRVASQQAAAATINVLAKIDGADQTSHALSYSASSRPVPKKARLGGRGYAHQLEITSTDDVLISAAELSAEILRTAGR